MGKEEKIKDAFDKFEDGKYTDEEIGAFDRLSKKINTSLYEINKESKKL